MYINDKKKQLFQQKTFWNAMQGILGMSIYGYLL